MRDFGLLRLHEHANACNFNAEATLHDAERMLVHIFTPRIGACDVVRRFATHAP